MLNWKHHYNCIWCQRW